MFVLTMGSLFHFFFFFNFRDMPAVIVNNFCKNNYKTFPMFGLRAIFTIIKRDVRESTTRAQMILMVHLTKMKLTAPHAAIYYEDCSLMIIAEMSEQLHVWKSFAPTVLQHNDVSCLKKQIKKDSKFWKIFRRKISKSSKGLLQLIKV